ncbi:hypothetical protein ACOMHN_046467 [Nucella lapillus]
MSLMMMVVLLLLQLTVGSIYANDNSGGVVGQGQGQGHAHSGHAAVPTFNSVEELCQWLCQKHSPQLDYGCPPSCDGGILGQWSKRAARGRRFDDFSFGFDDYLFMKLLGRDLGDRA